MKISFRLWIIAQWPQFGPYTCIHVTFTLLRYICLQLSCFYLSVGLNLFYSSGGLSVLILSKNFTSLSFTRLLLSSNVFRGLSKFSINVLLQPYLAMYSVWNRGVQGVRPLCSKLWQCVVLIKRRLGIHRSQASRTKNIKVSSSVTRSRVKYVNITRDCNLIAIPGLRRNERLINLIIGSSRGVHDIRWFYLIFCGM